MYLKIKKSDYKICVFLVGILIAVGVYRGINMDFLFYRVEYDKEAFQTLSLFHIAQDIKIFFLIFLLSNTRYKHIVLLCFTAYIGYLSAAIILISFMWKCANLWIRLIHCIALWCYINTLLKDYSFIKKIVYSGLIFLLSVFIQVFLKILF